MPTNYKVLGQVTGTAPTTSATTVNFVTDPSFEGVTLSSRAALGSGYTYKALGSSFGTTPWVAAINDSSNSRVTTNIIEGVAAAANAGTTALGLFMQASGNSNAIGLGPALATVPGNGSALTFPTSASPVVGGTTIYPAFSFYRTSGSVQGFYIQILQYNAAGTYITDNLFGQQQGHWTSSNGVNAWFRYVRTQGITLNSATAFVVVEIVYTANASDVVALFDGITISTDLNYATNFVSPNNASAVAPFTARFNPFYSGTPFFSSSIQTFAGAQNTLYTVPSGTQTVVSTISIANLGTTASSYRIAVRPSGQTLATRHWLAFDAPIGANSTDTFTLGITMSAGDVIIVQTDSSLVSFSAFGSEIS